MATVGVKGLISNECIHMLFVPLASGCVLQVVLRVRPHHTSGPSHAALAVSLSVHQVQDCTDGI